MLNCVYFTYVIPATYNDKLILHICFQLKANYVDNFQKSRLPKLLIDFPWKNPTNFAKKILVDYYL